MEGAVVYQLRLLGTEGSLDKQPSKPIWEQAKMLAVWGDAIICPIYKNETKLNVLSMHEYK